MRVLALDLSLTSTGMAFPDGGVTRLQFKSTGIARLRHLRDAVLVAAVGNTNPDVVVIEGFSYGSKGSSIDEVYGLGWVIRLALAEAERPYAVVPPASLKKYATGKGNASKEEMLVAAVKRLGYDGSSNDEADALWLRAMALDAYGEPVVEMPAAHRVAAGVVDWPELSAAVA